VYHALIWLIVVELLGLLALPLTFRLFSRLPDRGVTFSKALSILLLTYGAWLLGLTHVVPNSRYTLIALMVLLAVLSLFVLWRRWRDFRDFLSRERVPILVGEAVFLGLFVLWVAIVSHTPEINHTEKPMDLAFLNASLRSRFFPPEDPWLAGHAISYYYMGHMMMAMLTKLTGIASSVSYNLSICLIPALTGSIAYGLVYNLIRLSGARIRSAATYALFAPLLVGLIGNLEGVMEFAYLRGWGSRGFWEWVSVKGLHPVSHSPQEGVFPEQHWWWWRGSRVVDTLDYTKSLTDPGSLDYTINEVPFFSFILGDMHPHVLSLPFFLMSIGLILNIFLSPVRVGFRWLRAHPWESLAAAVIIGSLGFINVIDFPVIAALLAVAVLAKAYGENRRLLPSLWATVVMLAPILIAAVLLYLPFYRTLNSQVPWDLAVIPVEEVATQPFHYILVWGFLAFLGLSYLGRQLFSRFAERERNRRLIVLLAVGLLGPFALWALVTVFLGVFDEGPVATLLAAGNKFIRILPLAAIAGVGAHLAFSRTGDDRARSSAMLLLLLAAAFYLIMGTELFHLNDLFGNRMNTVFKLYYQAWILLALVGAYGLFNWLSRPVPRRLLAKVADSVWMLIVGFLLVCSLYYSVGAILDKTGRFKDSATLDGLEFVRESSPGEYEAIEWLRDEAEPGRIVEAVGGVYSEFGRVSAVTGLATVIGWEGHERQWRGSDELFKGRKDEVAQVYQSGDPDTVLGVLEKYDVRYVVVGRRERTAYGEDGLTVFDGLLERAFESGDVVIYQRS
jgi:YYY domain-containing protein